MTHQVLVWDQAWVVDLEPSIVDGLPKPRLDYLYPHANWSECAYYLQGHCTIC